MSESNVIISKTFQSSVGLTAKGISLLPFNATLMISKYFGIVLLIVREQYVYIENKAIPEQPCLKSMSLNL